MQESLDTPRERTISILQHAPVLLLLGFWLYRTWPVESVAEMRLIAALSGALGSYVATVAMQGIARTRGARAVAPRTWHGLRLPVQAAAGALFALLATELAFRFGVYDPSVLAVSSFVVGSYARLLVDVLARRISTPRGHERSIAASDEALSPSPGQPDLDGAFAAKEAELRVELARNPQDEAAARRLLALLRSTRRYDGAAVIYDRLIASHPRDYDLFIGKADNYRDMGDLRRYNETIRQAERIRSETSFEQNLGTSIVVLEAEVQGVHFFSGFKWALQPNVNVLLGRNGYGKSHLLRAIVATLQNDVEVTGEFVEAASPDTMIRVDVRRGDTVARTLRKPLVFEEAFGKVPVLAIPDMRYIDKSDQTLRPSSGSVVDLRSQGAEHFMRDQSFESVILTFLYEICIDYFDAGKTFDLPVFRLIENTLQGLTGSAFSFQEIRRLDSARFEVRVLTDGNESTPLPLQKASQGTLSVLSMVGLIFKYLSKLYPQVPGQDVAKQQGIVVIDEIDAHLHPVWQQRVLQLFRDTFPNVQFIVTAHTPLVVAGCRSREVSILQRFEGGFAVRVLEQHFIGATAADMYEELFEIEEKDLTFLRFKALAPDKDKMVRKVAELQVQNGRSAEQETNLRRLKDQLYYLDEVEQVSAERDQVEDAESRRQALELEAMNLRGEVARLKAMLERKEEVPEALDVSGAVEIIREFIERNPERAPSAEPFVKYLSRQGGYKEAAFLLEALHRSEPKNLSYMKGLAVQYQALKEYPKATEILRRAQTDFPADTSVQAALRHIEAAQQRAGTTES